MMTNMCKNGHVSSDADYCSVCGVALETTSGPVPASASVAAVSAVPTDPLVATPIAPAIKACPECGEPRLDLGARFCEVCRHNFDQARTGPAPMTGILVVAKRIAEPASIAREFRAADANGVAPAAIEIAPPPPVAMARWRAVATVDPTLDVDPDPTAPCPTNQPEQAFELTGADSLIGRLDTRRDIHPEVALTDPGVSRRHAKFLRQADGGLTIVDLASANGTAVNGNELTPGTPFRLRDGDQIALGRWTRLTVRESLW